MKTQKHRSPITASEVPKTRKERVEWIKYQLRVRGSSLAAIAREQGVTRHAARIPLVRPYPRMERAIAEKLGCGPELLWTDRYDRDRRRTVKMGRPRKSVTKNTPKRGTRNGARQEAA